MTSGVRSGRALISGSMAYDTIMVFGDRFAKHILPDKIHLLNVSFLVPQLRREYGGCAGNIAYNLQLLGDVGCPMATVGRDFGPYKEWLAHSGVPTDYIRVVEAEFTAQSSSPPTWITTRSRRFIRGRCNARRRIASATRVISPLASCRPRGARA